MQHRTAGRAGVMTQINGVSSAFSSSPLRHPARALRHMHAAHACAAGLAPGLVLTPLALCVYPQRCQQKRLTRGQPGNWSLLTWEDPAFSSKAEPEPKSGARQVAEAGGAL